MPSRRRPATRIPSLSTESLYWTGSGSPKTFRRENICALAVSRRITGKTQIFQLKVQLRNVRPPIWRRLLVPSDMTLADLHDVIQTAMGWTNTHLHEFEIDGMSYGEPDADWDSPE